MRKTYAFNSVIFGALFGFLVYAMTKSIILGVLTALAVSVVGFVIIRLIENAIHKGVDKASEKIQEAYHRHKEEKAKSNGTYVERTTTQMPDDRTRD